MEVSLFVPCYVDQLAPEVGLATLRLLERLGCRVRVDADAGCCGQPLLNAGAHEAAQRLARRCAKRLETSDTIVCPSASCVATLRRRSRRLGIEAARLSDRVFELGEFLVNKLEQTDVAAAFPHRVALLQSCHGLRELALGVASEASCETDPAEGVTARLLRQVRGLDLVLPERADECCGFGGLFAVRHPELSVRIGRDRLRALAATGAAYVTATDVSCLLHLDGIRRREGWGPASLHLAQILAMEAS